MDTGLVSDWTHLWGLYVLNMHLTTGWQRGFISALVTGTKQSISPVLVYNSLINFNLLRMV